MADNEIEVFVQDVVRDRRGRTVVVAVPDNGELRVGDKFILSYKIPRTVEDILNERPREAPVDCMEVALTVTAIDSMRKLIDKLPRGVTGGLYLSGEGIEHVAAKRYLRTAPLDAASSHSMSKAGKEA